MSYPRPTFFAFIDTSASNIDMNYELNPLNVTGFQNEQTIPSAVHNTLWLVGSWWDIYRDYGVLRTEDYVNSVDQRWSSTKLAYSVGASVIAAGASTTSQGVYFFDEVRVTVTDGLLTPARASPLLFPEATRPGRLWVYLRTADIAFPVSPTASIRVESVGAGVAENPQAQELALVGVDIDAAGVVLSNTYPAVEPPEEVAFGSRTQRWTGKTIFDGSPASFLNPGAITALVEGQLSIDGAAITGLDVVNDDAVNPSMRVENATGVSAAFVSETNTAVEATTNVGTAVLATATGVGIALAGIGGPGAASRAGSFLAGHVDSITLLGTSTGGSSSTAVAVQGTGNADGTGVKGFADAGYGVVARSDTTSPTRAALRLEPQNDDPSTALQGDVLLNSARGVTGKLRVYTSQWESVHSSAEGRVWDAGLAAAGGPIVGGSGNLSLAQAQPEQTGALVVEGTGSLFFNADNARCRVDLVDITGAPIVIATQEERAIDTDGAGQSTRSFVIKGRYTVPDTALRTYAIVLTGIAGGFDYSNVVTELRGMLP